MIYVTGGTGLVGSHLLFQLVKAGKKVRGLKRNTSNTGRVKNIFSYYSDNFEALFQQIEWVEGDVLDTFSLEDSLEDIKQVYHCAATVSFSPGDREFMLKTNVEGTANLVNIALEKGIEKFCFVSSIAALGRVGDDQEIDETVNWKTSRYNSAYAISKYNSEREIWRGMEEGLKAVIVSPSVIIGPGNWNEGSGQLFQTADNNMKFYSMGVNGFVDVRDVADSMIRLMESNIENDRFLVTAENLSYKDLFFMMTKELGKNPPGIKVTRLISEVAWRFEKLKQVLTGIKPLVTRETARTAISKYFYTNRKIVETIDMKFIPIADSIADTARIYLLEKERKDETG